MADTGVGFIKKAKFTGIKPSLLIALLVFIIHLLVVGLLLHDSAAKSDQYSEQLIELRLLPADVRPAVNPAIAPYRPPPSTAITLKSLEPLIIDIEEAAASTAETKLFRSGDPGLFDPRLRKKLSDISSRAAAQPIQELKSWADASGTQIVEVKPGECIRAMPGDTNARGDNWSLSFKCGKSTGEKMIDNINTDMAERSRRKHNK